MSTLEGLATALEGVVGSAHLLTGTAAAEYAIDDIAPAMVACPADDQQIAAVLRLAAEHHAAVFPRGGGSHMFIGQTPAQVDLVLSVARLQQQLAYEPGDMTTTVQAGLQFAALQRTLGGSGQFLALDPPVTPGTTLGGIVATNASGPRRLLYGTARDLLLGIAVVTMDGKRTRAGGRVVKNVTGYDLNKLYVGSLGTLAVIVELTWKVHPLPPGERTLGIPCTHHADLLPLLQMLLQLPLRLNSLALVNATASRASAAHTALTMPDSAYLLIARLEGTPAVLQSQEQRLAEALRQAPGTRATSLQAWSAADQERLWAGIGALTRGDVSLDTAPQCMVVKVSLLRSALPAFYQEVEALAGPAEAPWSLVAHAGSGIVYVGIPVLHPESPDVERLAGALQALDTCVARAQGRRVIERAPAGVKQRCQVWGEPGDDVHVMRAIKATFDPQHRLNPGRFLGGI